MGNQNGYTLLHSENCKYAKYYKQILNRDGKCRKDRKVLFVLLRVNNIMKVNDIILESWPGRNKNKIYKLLVDATDSGPFDGGCVIFAQALQMKYGGDIFVLVNHKEQADHAAVKIGNVLIDADGPAEINAFVKRFERNERVDIKSIRPIRTSDLSDAPRNIELAEKIAGLL